MLGEPAVEMGKDVVVCNILILFLWQANLNFDDLDDAFFGFWTDLER